jgi:DNA replication and repair protein RecF
VPLQQVRIENFRCIELAELSLDGRRSYIFGPNGAGKTSVLEAIYLLSRGRSFRSRQNKRLIRHGQSSLTVFAETRHDEQTHRLGIQLGDDGLEARIDGEKAGSVAALARRFPAHVIEPNIHQLIEGGPSTRRRFLDWGVFHVEQGFLEAWRRFRRVLGQRNSALKQGLPTESWDPAFLEAGEAVNSSREHYVEALNAVVERIGRELTGQPVALSYRRGWPRGSTLESALEASMERDRSYGATQIGPHRADLAITMDEHGVREEASRGQQKLVAAALIVSQVQVFAEGRGDGGILLVDDPAAELDAMAFKSLMAVLDTLPAQLILTGLSETALPPMSGFPVFHVERGKIASMV